MSIGAHRSISDGGLPAVFFSLPPAGGLGWALPSALGARSVSDVPTVALVGDGAYMFANPAACHHASAKHDLPVLTVIANNSSWGAVDYATRAVYPEGEAVARGDMRLSDLGPSPAFEAYCAASGGFGERVVERPSWFRLSSGRCVRWKQAGKPC